jgi:hypothetical protein
VAVAGLAAAPAVRVAYASQQTSERPAADAALAELRARDAPLAGLGADA